MTIKLKVRRFRTRRPDPVTAPDPTPRVKRLGDDAFFPSADDGFGAGRFATAQTPSQPAANDAEPRSGAKAGAQAAPRSGMDAVAATPAGQVAANDDAPQDIDAIRREGLTGRQLRVARRLAQRHGLPATSDFDAVRLLRKAGIDPLQRSTVLDLVASDTDEPGAEPSRALTIAPPGDPVKLPQTIKPMKLPSTDVRADQAHIAEVARIQRDMATRRRRKMLLLVARMFFFVGLPTMLAGWYYYVVATPLYSSHTEFVIQQAGPASASGLGSLLGGTTFATSQDSIAVQGYLQSPEAMARLDADLGFRSHFSDPSVDPIQRLNPDATNAAAYKLYKRSVKISYDPTEGLVKMEVSATVPETAAAFSRALISYAEEQVDHLTKRLRDNQMAGARQSYEEAEQKMLEAQRKTVELQEKFKILSSEVEVGLITTQIGALETQMTQDRLGLAQMESNASPNLARMEPLKRRIATLEAEIENLRRKLTQNNGDGLSLAQVQSELLVAQANVTTRQLMLAQSLQAMESSRVEANRQTRYLSISVNPIVPDEPSYPRAFENTIVVMLIFLGIYMMITMTVAILKEQLTA